MKRISRRLSLQRPVEIQVEIIDENDYIGMDISSTNFCREDLIEAAKDGVLERKNLLERQLRICVEVLIKNYSQGAGALIEGCIQTLAAGMEKYFAGNSVAIDVIYEHSFTYFRAHIPDEVLEKVAQRNGFARPITLIYGMNLFDFTQIDVATHIVPSYVYSDLDSQLNFNVMEWTWGEA